MQNRTIEQLAVQKRIDMDLLSRSHIGVITYIVVFPAIFYPLDYYSLYPALSWAITLTVWVACALRIVLTAFTKPIYEQFPRAWTFSFVLLSLVKGCILGGYYALVIFDNHYDAMFPICTLVVAGVASGASASLAPKLSLSIMYQMALLIPAIIASAYSQPSYVYVVLMIMYWGYLTVLAVLANRLYMRNFLIEAELKEQKLELERLSRTDPLTGIYNRRYFNEVLESHWNICLRSKTPLSTMMIDIDHFKQINDKYGHPAGDQCIKEVASSIKNDVKRKTDAICRFGGEEFAILLDDVSIIDAETLAETIRSNIEKQTIKYEDVQFFVTVSIGVASVKSCSDMHSQNLIDQADQALYRAKRSGRNCVLCFNHS